MCLIISAKLARADHQSISKLPPDAIAVAPIRVCVPHPSFWQRSPTITLSERDHGGCACSLLHDDASWDHPSWLLRSEIREPLAATLRRLRDHLSAGFDFQALWVGEQPANSSSVSITTLCDLITGDGLGTTALYHVE
jgi:hypothetical protein